MKSIYNQDDLRCNATGLELSTAARNWFESMLERYPDYNPRELVELFSAEFSSLSSRRILNLRRSGVLNTPTLNETDGILSFSFAQCK